ncbi:hypothetical protein HYY74_02625 [Candidatus Woesearchaeota archaeon]|nr:hypothetical protein [Candidatus Woesearchaeota archaeon]
MPWGEKRGGRLVSGAVSFRNLKSAGVRSIWPFILVISLLSLLAFGVLIFAAVDVESPANSSYSTNNSISLFCEVKLDSDENFGPDNLTNVSLWTNMTGTFLRNQTVSDMSNATNIFNGSGNGKKVQFNLSGIGPVRGEAFYWFCSVAANASHGTVNESRNQSYKRFQVDSYAPVFVNQSWNNATYVSSLTNVIFAINVTEHNLVNANNVTVYYRRQGTDTYVSNATSCNFIPAIHTAAHNCSLEVNVQAVLGLSGAHGNVVEYNFNLSDAGNRTNNTPVFTVTLDTRTPTINSTRVNLTKSASGASLAYDNPNTAGTVLNVSGRFTLNITTSDDGGGVYNASATWVNGTGGTSRNIGEFESMVRQPASHHYWVDFDTSTWIDGLVNISINVTDNASNVNTSINITLLVDNKAPVLQRQNPLITANTTNVSSTILVNFTVWANKTGAVATNSSGIRNVTWYWINGSGYGPSNIMTNVTNAAGTGNNWGHYNATVDASAFADGLQNITINATDWAGNTVLQNLTFVVDKTAPTVAGIVNITYESRRFPTNVRQVNITRNVTGYFFVNVSVNDTGSGIANVSWYWINSSGSKAQFTGDQLLSNMSADWSAEGVSQTGDYNVTIDASAFANGLLNITINASDWAGNYRLSNFTVNITSDESPPIITNASPASQSFIRTGLRIWSVNVTELNFNVSRNATIFYRVYSPGLSSWTRNKVMNCSLFPSSAPVYICNTSINVAAASELSAVHGDVVEFIINATDGTPNLRAANGTENTPLNVTIDTKTPFYNATNTPTSGGNVSATITLNVTLSDDGGGVGLATYQWANESNGSSSLGPATAMSRTAGTNFYSVSVDVSAYAEGTSLNLTVNVTDVAGTSNYSVTNITVLVDNTRPNGTILSPVIAVSNQSDIFLLNVTASDGGSLVRNVSWYWINGSGSGPLQRMTNVSVGADTAVRNSTFNYTIDTLGFPDGLLNITVNVTDWGGAANLTNFTIRVDRTNASIAILNPVSGANLSGSFLLNTSVNDTGSGIRYVFWYWANASRGPSTGMSNVSNPIAPNGSIGNFNATVPSTLDNGVTFISINVTDWAANVNDTGANVSVTIDNVAPNLTRISLTGINVTSTTVLNFTVNDSFSRLRNVSWYWINGSGSGPLQRMTNVTALAVTANTYGTFNATVDVSTFAAGAINITVNATDWAGNTALSNVTLIVDSTAPTVGIVSPANGTNQSGSVLLLNASVNDTVSGIRFVFWYWENQSAGTTQKGPLMAMSNVSNPDGVNGTVGYFNSTVVTTQFANGMVNITVNATDWSGNQQTAEKISIMVDNLAPTLKFVIAQTGGFENDNLLINISTNDTASGIKNVSVYWINSSAPTGNYNATVRMTNVTLLAGSAHLSGVFNVTVSVSAYAEGLLNFTVNVTDWSGNSNLSNLSITVDVNVTRVALVAPSSDSRRGATVTFNYTVLDANPQNCSIYTNSSSGNAWVSNGTNLSVSGGGAGGNNNFSLTFGVDGDYAWNVFCNDSASNTAFNATNFTIHVDANAPILANWTYNESSRLLSLGFNELMDSNVTGVTLTSVSLNYTDGSIADGVANLGGGNSTLVPANSSTIFIKLTSGQDAAVRKIQQGDSVGVNITLYGAAAKDLAGNNVVANTSRFKNYIKPWYESADLQTSPALTIHQTSQLQSWGWNTSTTQNWNISLILTNIGGLGANYNVVYYNTDGTDTGWKTFSRTDWVGSDLKYINNTNDKQYQLNITGNSTKFRLCCRTLS